MHTQDFLKDKEKGTCRSSWKTGWNERQIILNRITKLLAMVPTPCHQIMKSRNKILVTNASIDEKAEG